MSIRPVDLQVMVQKTTEVNRLNQSDPGKAEVAQQQFAEQFQKGMMQSEQQVAQTNKSDQEAIYKDGKGSGNQEKKGKKNKKNGNNQNEDQKEMKSNSMFDIKV